MPEIVDSRVIRQAVGARHKSFSTSDSPCSTREHGVAIGIAAESELNGYSIADFGKWPSQVGHDVFLYVISGFTQHSPAAAMAPIERLK
jgi:hypothetical protein